MDRQPHMPLDLYARLGLDGPSDRGSLLAALDSPATDPGIRRTAAFIFHDELRRREHDAWWRTLSAVSILRTQLGLSAAVHWSRQPNGDFAHIHATSARMREAMPTGALSADVAEAASALSADSRGDRAKR
jgi:hypothetical protein